METKLTRLYNTLVTIETKGESTKTMADCLRYIEQMVAEEKANRTKSEETNGD